MDKIISYRRNPEDDYYFVLGCDELSSTEQIMAEYKARVRSCHPDKVPNNPAAAAQFVKLQKVKDILCDESARRKYDQWRLSGINISYEDWCARSAHHASMHWAGTRQKDAMIESSSAAATPQLLKATVIGPEDTGNDEQMLWQDLRLKFRNYEI